MLAAGLPTSSTPERPPEFPANTELCLTPVSVAPAAEPAEDGTLTCFLDNLPVPLGPDCPDRPEPVELGMSRAERVRVGRCDMQKIGQPRTRLHPLDPRPGRGLAYFLLHGRGRHAPAMGATAPQKDDDPPRFLPQTPVWQAAVAWRAGPEMPLLIPPLHPGYSHRLERPPR